jgi:hypothetical protein
MLRTYGPATGINWCESDYALTPHIAEFWNTISNVGGFILAQARLLGNKNSDLKQHISPIAAYVVAALSAYRQSFKYRLPVNFYFYATALLMTGACSAWFHSTLWHSAQKADESFETATLAFLFHYDKPWTGLAHSILAILVRRVRLTTRHFSLLPSR